MYKKKYGKIMFGLFFCLIFSTSCSNQTSMITDEVKNSNNSTIEDEVIFTNRQEKIFKEGYEVDGYKILLTKKQQESMTEKKCFYAIATLKQILKTENI